MNLTLLLTIAKYIGYLWAGCFVIVALVVAWHWSEFEVKGK